MGSGYKQQRKENCHDRINYLPDEVIGKILVHLPIREAVATSKLSRAWRCKWMSIPELVFKEHPSLQGQTSDQLVNFVNNVLLLHVGDITKFEINNLLESAYPNVDLWLMLLWRKKLNHLLIHFKWPASYRCPSTLFNCQDLRTLVLQSCELQLPLQIQFNGFKNLTLLRLFRVTAKKETIEFLVNNSPLLQELSINLLRPIPHLSINAPNLRTCRIALACEGITFTKTPKLQWISIKTWLHAEVSHCNLGGILGGIVQVVDARICHPFIEFLSFNNFWERLPIIYCHLKHVHLGMDFEDPKQILAALWLCRSSPLLKTMHIIVERMNKGVWNEDLHLEEFYGTLNKRGAILQSLEIFDLQGFEGSKNELRFIEFVLLNASVLQAMKINWKINMPVGLIREGAALFKLVQFQRTSSRVKMELLGWEHSNNL